MEGELNLNCIYCNARLPTELVELLLNNQEVLCERCGYALINSDFPQLQVRSAPEQLNQYKKKDLVSRIIDKVNTIAEKTEKKQESPTQNQPYSQSVRQPSQMDQQGYPPQSYSQSSQPNYSEPRNRYVDNARHLPPSSESSSKWNTSASYHKEDPYIGKIIYSEPRSFLTDSDRKTLFGLQKAAHIISNILFTIGFFISFGVMAAYSGQVAMVTPLYYLLVCGISLIIDNSIIYPKYRDGNEHPNLGIDEIILGIATMNVFGMGIPRILTGLFILLLTLDSLNRRLVALKGRSLGAKEAQLFGALSILKYIYAEGNRLALLIIGYAFATILMSNLGAWPELIFISILGPIALTVRKKNVVEPVYRTSSFRLEDKNIAFAYVASVLSMFFGVGFLFLLEAVLLSAVKQFPNDATNKFFEGTENIPQSSNLKAELLLSPASKRSNEHETVPGGLPFKIRPIENESRLDNQSAKEGKSIGGAIKRFDPYTGKPLIPQADEPKEITPNYIPNFEERIYTVLSDRVKYELNQLDIDKEEKSDLLHSFIYLDEEEQLKYIKEIKASNQTVNTNLVERIQKLHIKEEQKASLIQQLEYLSEPEQENFVRFLEKSAKGAEA